MKEIRLAKTAGFCYGVNKSVEMAEKLIDEVGECYSYGEIIHNTDVCRYLDDKGLHIINSVEQVQPGSHILIRSHGVSKKLEENIGARGGIIHDATCINVKKIHDIVTKAAEEGRFVIVIGTRNHPEVEAVRGRCGAHEVFENLQELSDWWQKNPQMADVPVTMVVQTTQLRKNFTECSDFLKKMCTNPEISDTMCFATSARQKEAEELSAKCDAMVVIGGKHSANSMHLADICRTYCSNVQFIENVSGLNIEALKECGIVGITAGASTPLWIIKEVRNRMNEEVMNEVMSAEEAVPAEEKELSFEEMLEENLKPIHNGDKVTGIVESITATEVNVSFVGSKYSGIIPTTEYTDSGIKVEDAVKVGDTVDAIVVKVTELEGIALLSKKRLDAIKGWLEVEEACESGEIVEGKVVEQNKGGIVVNVKGVRVFVPGAQTDLPKDADLSQLLNTDVKLKIKEFNKGRKRVIGSIRDVTRAERREKMEKFWSEIEVGKHYNGVVKSMTGYGAFVDIGGIDGMVHVTELSWGRISKPSDVLSVGDEVDVYVISFDPEKRRISLGYKDPNAEPWALFTSKYQTGDVAQVKIVKLMDFGAFAEVVPGVDGLIHISQIATRHVEKAEEALAVGDVVDAKITKINEEDHKVSLSIRALSIPAPVAKEEAEEAEEEPAEDAVVYEVSAEGATGEAPVAEEE